MYYNDYDYDYDYDYSYTTGGSVNNSYEDAGGALALLFSVTYLVTLSTDPSLLQLSIQMYSILPAIQPTKASAVTVDALELLVISDLPSVNARPNRPPT